MPSQERNTANAIVTAFNSMNIDTIISLRIPGCQRIFLPYSLKYAPQSNETYRTSLEAMKSVFNSFKITVNDIIEGVSDTEVDSRSGGQNGKKKIVMFVTATGDTTVGEYRNEYVWRMAFEEGGDRVCEWSEFVDVGVSRDFMPKLKGEIARKMAEGSGV
jgi:hypothetical protein